MRAPSVKSFVFGAKSARRVALAPAILRVVIEHQQEGPSMRASTLIYVAMIAGLCQVGPAAAKGPAGAGSELDCSVEQRGWRAKECECQAAGRCTPGYRPRRTSARS